MIRLYRLYRLPLTHFTEGLTTMKLYRYPANHLFRTRDDYKGNLQVVEGDHAKSELRSLYRTLRKAGATRWTAHTAVYDLVFGMSLSTTKFTFVSG